MRSTIRLAVLLTLSCLAACRGNTPLQSSVVIHSVPDASTSGEEQDEDAGQAGGGSVNGDPGKTVVMAMDAATEAASPIPPPEAGASPPATDASPAEAQPPGPDASAAEAAPATISCATLAAGGKPDRLKDFQWMIQTSFSQSQYDIVTFDSTCKMTFQHVTMGATGKPPTATTKSVTMSADDCGGARAWATNERFLQVLRTGESCPYGDGNPGDVFDLNLNDEGRVARKTYLCPEPTVEAVRACLRPLVARLFP